MSTTVSSSKISAEEFKERFLLGSGMTEDDFERMGFCVVPCDCGHSFCQGWQADAPFLTHWLEGLHGSE